MEAQELLGGFAVALFDQFDRNQQHSWMHPIKLQELLNDLQMGVPATKVASGIRDRLSVLGIRAPFRKEEEKVSLVVGDPDFFDFLD
jgi:hypothetical protein